LKPYIGFIKLGAAAALGFVAWYFDATFVGYVPSLLLVLWSFD
jgi:hypothetical protein